MAAEIVRRLRIEPPVDLFEVASNYADLEFDEIPGECDGLLIGLHGPRPRPLIILDQGRHELRRRFTLAHELGHVLLPWHTGTFACDPRRTIFGLSGVGGAYAEPEANRFAGELLVPTAWLNRIVRDLGADSVTPLLSAVEQAEVSAWVACLRLTNVLPPRHVFAMVDLSQRVVLSGQTRGTQLSPPKHGDVLDRRLLDRFATACEEIRYRSRRIIWWQFSDVGDDDLDEAGADARDSSTVLQGLLRRHAAPEDVRAVQMRLAGIIGAANSSARREGVTSRAELYARFASRFAKNRELPYSLLHDEDFETWLRKRAAELGNE